MKLFIMTDLEGVAGVISGKEYLYPAGRYYETARRLLTEEVNAAIAGFALSGFTEFLVADGHGAGAINIDLLDSRANLIRGWGRNVFPFGLTREFDAMIFVGQHAKAGTSFSHLTHTGWWNVRDLKLNGISIGEYGQGAFCAGELGVPVIFASGEKALEDEVKNLTPWVHTVSVLRGVIELTGDELSGEEYEVFHEAAIHMQPTAACDAIRTTAELTGRHFLKDRSAFKLLKVDAPYRTELSLRAYQGQPAKIVTLEHRDSVIALFNTR